jgi:hypothetical protein
VAVEPNPPPRPADDVIQDPQRSGWSRWTPRRAGFPALIDWWPAYVLLPEQVRQRDGEQGADNPPSWKPSRAGIDPLAAPGPDGRGNEH